MPLTRPTTPEEAEERLKSAFVLDDFGDVGGEVEDFPIPDKKSFLKTSATSAWAQGVIGSPVSPYQVGWQGQKDGIVRSYFNEKDASGVSDDDLFSKIAEDYKAKDALAEAARNAAARGESWQLKFREVEQTMPNVAGGRQIPYLELAREVHDKFRSKILPYQSIIKSVAEKAKSIETSPEGMDWSGMAQELIQVPKESRPFVLEAISRQATANIDANAASRLGKEFARGFERFLDTAMSGSYNVLAAAGQYSEIPLAPETPQEIEARKARESQDADLMDLRDDIRDISTGKLAKLEDVRLLGMNISGAARNVPMTIGAFVPYIGPAALVGSFQRETANELRRANPTMSRETIEGIATISAPFQALTEVVSDRLLFGKLPNLKRLFTTPVFSSGGIAAFVAGRAVMGTATEYAEEFTQGAVPKIVQSLSSDVPDVDWDGYFQDFKDQSPELLATIIPLALFGAGVGQATDYRASVQMLYSADEMMAAKIPESEARKISELAATGKRPEAESLFRQEFRKAATKGEAPAEMRAAAQRVIAANQAQKQTFDESLADPSKIGATMYRDAEGWKVETYSGIIIKMESAEAAARYVHDLKLSFEEYQAETVIALADDLVQAFPGTRLELSPSQLSADKENGLVLYNPVTDQKTVLKDAKTLENLWKEASAISFDSGNSPQYVLGQNFMEFGQSIARVFRDVSGRVNSVPQAITAMHEVIEAAWRKGVIAGQWSVEGTRQMLASLAPAIESGITKLGKKAQAEELRWLDNLKKAIASNDENLIRETFVEMSVRTWIGRDRDGNKTGLRPGTILRALDAAILQEKSPENVTTYQRLRAWFKAVGAYLKGVVATAKIIRDAERNGTIDDFTGFLDKVLGIETATREESEVKDGVIDMAFSLAPELKNAQVGMSDAEITRYDETEKLRREAVKTAEAELAKLKEKRTTGVSWDEAYSDPEEGGVDPVPDGKTANHWTLLPPKDFQNLDRLYYDIDEYENGIVFGVNKSRKGNGDTWGEFPSLAEAKAAAEADFIQEAGEEWTGSFGANLDSQEVIKPIFNHFALPDGVEFEKDTAWGVTKWGSWYAHVRGYDQKRGEVRTLKLSVRDHEATRKDMGLPDLTAEVSKSWTPQEVADALKRIERKVWKRLSAIEERDVQNMAFSLAPELKDGSTFSLAPTERDSEHLAAVEAGDIAKVQRLVNKAARDAGTVWDVGDGQMYHGTRSEIEVMRTPAFFSPNPEMIYDQQQENKQHDYGDQIKPFFLFGKVKYGVEMPEYTWGVRSVEDDRITAAEDEGYDIVELVPYGDTSGGENSFFVAVNPSAIKSADPVTYDDAGNIIPLSQRFNAASPDIRFSLSPQSGIDIVSDTLESWQDVFDKAAKRNPTRAMAIRDLAQQRINRLGEMWAADRWTAKGDKIRAVVEKRTKSSLDDEQAMREALLEGEKLAANMEASQAKAEAKAEAAEWRQEADDMQADDWSPRESLVRDMRVLNVALSAFPPEVRAKVTGGSMVKLAGLATERARYKAIQKALEKAIVETEVFMRKEYTEQVDNALDSYRSQKDSSGRISGKLPSQYTELVDYAYRIREASIEDQATESGGLEKALEESESDQQTQSVLTKMGILRLFEAWEMKDSTAMAAASEWLSETIENGKLGRKLLDEDRKAMLDDFRATAKKDAVPEGKISKVDVDNETNNVRFKVFRRAWQGINGMLDSAVHTIGQRLELVFGENSKITDHFITSFIQAANASNDIKRDVNRKYHDMLSVVFNSRSRLAHARGIGQMQKVKASGIMITEGRVVEETKLNIETLTKLADGTMTAEAAGLRQDQVDAALEEWAASERNRTVTVETVKNAGEQKERQMTELQGLQWWLWSRQDASRKQMERDGWTEESFAQLDAFLSPEAKALGEWIAKGYDDAARLIDPVYRRLFRAPLPRVKNYAPIYRNRSGDASVMDLDASDISSGLSAGFTKSRVNTVSPLAEMDAVTVMLTHWENVAHWVTHAEAVRDAKAVLLDRDVMTAIKQSSGNVSANSIKQRIAAIESQGTNAAKELHDLNRFWRWLMQYRAFKGLAFRISPVIKQTPALLNPLLADVPAHSYTVGLARAFYDPNAFNREVAEMFKSDTIMRRIEGGFSAEARITMQGEGAIGSVALALMQKGMMPMSWTDGGWTALGAAVSYDYYKRGYMSENPKASTAMADAYATRRLEKMIAVSAQPSDIVNRSLVEASPNNFMRSLWMFASDQRKALGIEVTALKKLLSGKSKNKAMDVQRILVAHFAQTAMSQLMASIMASFLGDDEDKEREWSREQWTLSLALGPINGLFVLGRMIDMTGRRILNMQAVQDAIGTGVKLPIFTNKTLFEQGVNDIWNGATSVDDLFNPEDPDDFIGAMESLTVGGSTAMSMAIGPQAGVVDVTANLVREGNKVIKAMSDEK